jgi:hypothetical protein
MHDVRDLVSARISQESRSLRGRDPAASIENAVTAACVSDLQPDYRDMYVSLGELWLAAVERGIDPASVFERLAPLAASESTECFLAGFTTSTYFAQSIAPHL